MTDIIKRFNEMRDRMRSLMRMGMDGMAGMPDIDSKKFQNVIDKREAEDV